MTIQQQRDLEELCVEIFAHALNDYQVELNGCDTNCAEAENVADEIVQIMGFSKKLWRPRVEARAKELRIEHGEEEDDSWAV
jgi:hypothetical protein